VSHLNDVAESSNSVTKTMFGLDLTMIYHFDDSTKWQQEKGKVTTKKTR